jgi:hypothetical protein
LKNRLKYLLIVLTLIGCQTHECNDIPLKFISFEEANSTIKRTQFVFSDNINTSKSSWIRDANYYSCDNQTGYFLIKTDDQEYIYINLPITIWNEFKASTSFGKYYNKNIKNKYQLILSK